MSFQFLPSYLNDEERALLTGPRVDHESNIIDVKNYTDLKAVVMEGAQNCHWRLIVVILVRSRAFSFSKLRGAIEANEDVK